jgi:aryl-alcohol dehydrogenase
VQTGAGTIMNVLQPSPGEPIGIFGAGGVGLSALMAATALECGPVVVVEPHAGRRQLALQLGAAHVLDPSEGAIPETIRKLLGEDLLYALDTSGLPAVLQQALQVLAPRGQLAVLTTAPADNVLPLSLPAFLGKGQVIRGVVEGESTPQHFIPELVDLVVSGRFPLEKIVKYYDFPQIEQALADQRALRTVKPIIRMPAVP